MIELPEGPWSDWDVLQFDGANLRLAAGYDLTYHHGLEIVFTDVAYLACPIYFWDPRFREPTPGERELVRRYSGEEPPVIVAFDIESPIGADLLPCLVAAEAVEIVVGLVYRYWREDLAAGERLAPNVRPPKL
ncbi:hypothetical protein [Dactylosporangium sp. NPDC048998]|uniref:hypothetical protein n=1 Tax=Dactylosporangium sp. NPDC048998 TaxID=3363976 RepID=UPI003721CF07